MAPCEVEGKPAGQKEWFEVDTLNPSDEPGIITNSTGKTIEIYIFRLCTTPKIIYL